MSGGKFGFSINLILKGVMTFQSQGVHPFCWTKIKKINKNRTESKMENPHTNCKLKVMWRVEAREKKKRAIFVPFTLSEGIFV